MLRLLSPGLFFLTASCHDRENARLFFRTCRTSITTAPIAIAAANPLHSISPPCPVRDTRHTRTIHRALPSTRHIAVFCGKGIWTGVCPLSSSSLRSCLPASISTPIYMPDTNMGRKIRWHHVNRITPAASPSVLAPIPGHGPGFPLLPPARQSRFHKNTRTTSAIIKRVRGLRSTGTNGPRRSTLCTVTARTASPAAPMMIAGILSLLPVSMQPILIPVSFSHIRHRPFYKSP